MAVFGALLKGAIGGYGKKPNVPYYSPIDVTKESGAAIGGNLENMAAAQKLATQTNAFNVAQMQKMLESILPGYGGIQQQSSNVIQSMLRGELPRDVQQAVQNAAAAKAIGGGFGGSGAHGSLVARDFGKTSYDITQQGLSSAQRWMAQTASMAMPQMMDVTSMFVSPQQRISYEFQNRENVFNREWMREQIKAAPDPFRAALGDAFIQDEQFIQDLIKEAVSAAGGGAMAMCWVAREVYGESDNRWMMFRHWLLHYAPKWFRNLYAKFGERVARWLRNKPLVKGWVRRWMDKRIEGMLWLYSRHQVS